MLAAGDVPPTAAPEAGWETAIQGQSVEIELLPFNQVLRITGPGSGNVVIDLDRLPASVVNLQISSFTNVTLTGDHKVNSLLLSEIGRVDAGRISIGSTLWANNVEHIKIDSAPDIVWLQGSRDESGMLTLGKRTLLDVGTFSSSPSAFIFAWVENLGLSATSPVETAPSITSYGTQQILLNFQPDTPLKVNTTGPVNVIAGGDFARYFFSTHNERAALEETPFVARLLAVVERVSMATLLSNPMLKAAITGATDSSQFRSHVRPLADTAWINSSLGMAAALSAQGAYATMEPRGDKLLGATGLNGALASDAIAPPVVVQQVSDLMGATRDLSADSFQFTSLPDSRTAEAEVEFSLALALAGLSEPFVQTVMGLQGRTASFGDLASARVTEHLRTDSRPALLADTRTHRQRESDDMVVLSV